MQRLLIQRLARFFVPGLAAALTMLVSAPARATDPNIEKQAQVLQKKAIEEDSLNLNYPEAIKKLAIAISKCAGDKCNPGLLGTLYRDIGAMLILSGSVEDGRAAFAKALGFDASLELDPAYKNATLEQPWNEAKKKVAPAPEAKALSGSAGATGQSSAEGANGQPPAGDGAYPPAGAGCPPDAPGCHSEKKGGGQECLKNEDCESGSCANDKCAEKKADGEECEKDDECAGATCAEGKCSSGKKGADEACDSNDQCASGACTAGKCAEGAANTSSGRLRKIWIGVAGSFDFINLPASDNVCIPSNGAGYTCVDASTGAAFPADAATYNKIRQGAAINFGDGIGGGFSTANVRLGLSFDYALGMNFLVGARAAYVLLTAPSPAFAPIHIEVRASLLLGKDALAKSVAPMLVLAAGAGEFDVSFPVVVQLMPSGTKNETAWITAGPVFAAAGAGARLLFAPNIAATALLKAEGAFGGSSGFLFGIAPELGLQFGL